MGINSGRVSKIPRSTRSATSLQSGRSWDRSSNISPLQEARKPLTNKFIVAPFTVSSRSFNPLIKSCSVCFSLRLVRPKSRTTRENTSRRLTEDMSRDRASKDGNVELSLSKFKSTARLTSADSSQSKVNKCFFASPIEPSSPSPWNLSKASTAWILTMLSLSWVFSMSVSYNVMKVSESISTNDFTVWAIICTTRYRTYLSLECAPRIKCSIK